MGYIFILILILLLKKMNLRSVLLFFLLSTNLLVFAQKSSYFDENLEREYKNINKITLQNPTKGLEASKKLIEIAKKKKNPYYELVGMSLVDYVYKNNVDYKKLLVSSNLTIAKSVEIRDFRREIEAHASKSWALMHLGMLPEAKKILDDTQEIFKELSSDNDDDVEVMGVFMAAYAEFYNLQEKDAESIKKDHVALDYFLKIKNNDNRNMHLIDTYSNMGLSYSYTQKTDSAYFYLQAAKDLIPITKSYSKKSENIIYFGLGSGYNTQKKHKEAIPYLMKSLEISKQNGYEDIYVESLNQLSISFKTSNNKDNLYYKKYLLAKEESENKNKLQSEEIKKIQNENSGFLERNTTGILIGVTMLLVTIFSYVFLQRKKNNTSEREKNIISETVKEQSLEITELRTNMNNGVDEVLLMAKNNDPSFLRRFSEVHPEVYFGLQKKYPELSESQFKILALSYLGFSTKDIASNTNTSPRTVQTHKYNIRKIIDISPDEDFIKWVQRF